MEVKCRAHTTGWPPFCRDAQADTATPEDLVALHDEPACPQAMVDRFFPGTAFEERGGGVTFGGGEVIPARGESVGRHGTMDIDGCEWKFAVYGKLYHGQMVLTARETEACSAEVAQACAMFYARPSSGLHTQMAGAAEPDWL